MSDFNWDEMPEEIVQEKAPKREIIPEDEIPAGIRNLVQVAFKDQKFHYQPLPVKEMIPDFCKLLRAASDYTKPDACTVIAKQVTEYPGADGKTKKVSKGVMVRYSAGIRRGRKGDEEATESASGDAESAE